MRQYTGLEIAVIGMAGRFPGAPDVQAFWNNLKGGIESICFASDDELLAGGESREVIQDPRYVKVNALMPDRDFFDAAFFNYRPDEARLMDPQTRVFHECVWQALEHAACDPGDQKNKIGLFAGASSNINWEVYARLMNREGLVDNYSVLQLSNARFLASKVSYALNLRGPAVFLDTACSTSLVAVHQACRSLLSGDCNVAVAGGVSLTANSIKGYLYDEGMILSKDGHCRTFDAESTGTIPGEGVAVIVFKTLKNALRDRDNILAVIKGSSINNDGNNKVAYTAPSVDGQSDVIRFAQKWAKVEPQSITLIEAHGTATAMGDPIEVEALNRVFGKSRERYCALTSVKSNIGHLDAAAGVAGLVKTVLALQNRQIPPSLNFNTPNPNIDFEESPFYVNTALKPWENDRYPLRAGVSSFGIGGTNAHVIVEDAPDREPSSGSRPYQLLCFSAKTPQGLNRNISNVFTFIKGNPLSELPDTAFTLHTGRSRFPLRRSVVCLNTGQGVKELISTPTDQPKPVQVKGRLPVIFMFPGQGSQYRNMCLELYRAEPAFAAEADRCFAIISDRFGRNIKSLLFTESDETGGGALDATENTQPALFIVEYALARLLMTWGIKPDAMIGHSIGEYVAACISGVFSLEDALDLVVRRGALMQAAAPGAMLSVSIRAGELEALLRDNRSISLAAVNSSEMCVVAGDMDAIARFKIELEAKSYSCKTLRTSHAFHSHMMDNVLGQFRKAVAGVKINEPRTPYISNLTGRPVSCSEIADPSYWVDHLRQTVRFGEGLETLLKRGDSIFVEVGPGKSLSSLVRSHQARQKAHVVINTAKSAHEDGNDQRYLLTAVGELWSHGVEPDWNSFYAGEVRNKIPLPTYAFEKVKYPVNVDAFKLIRGVTAGQDNPRIADVSQWFYTPSWKLLPPHASVQTPAMPSNILICADEYGPADLLASKLTALGNNVITISAGDGFAEISPGQFEVNPMNPEEYWKVCSRFLQRGFQPDTIIHAWGISHYKLAVPSHQDLHACFYSLLEVVRAVQQGCRSTSDIHLVVLTNDLHPVLDAPVFHNGKSLSLGLLKVLGQEYPALTTAHVDISLSEPIDETLIENIWSEVRDRTSGRVVSCRQGRKWLQIFEPVKTFGEPAHGELKNRGVYLITGGLGNLGYHLSLQLLKNLDARVILLGKSKLPPAEKWQALLEDPHGSPALKEKIRRMKTLTDVGGQVLYMDCDVSDRVALRHAVQRSCELFGEINGVIHAAGLAGARSLKPIDELKQSDFEEQFSPKVRGLQALIDVMGPRHLDFCLLTSSLSSVLGGIGFGAYGPANTFMDYCVVEGRRQGNLKNWISVNFDGLNFDQGSETTINKEEIFEVIRRLLSVKDLAQVAVSVSDLSRRLAQWVYRHAVSTEKQVDYTDDQPGAENDHGDQIDFTPTERKLYQLWTAFFGRADIGPDDSFFDIGGDSLKALTILSRISKAFAVDISIKDIFNRSTIRSLSAHIDSKSSSVHNGTSGSGSWFVGHKGMSLAITKRDTYDVVHQQKKEYIRFLLLGNQAFNMNLLMEFRDLNRSAMEMALLSVFERHESLRSNFLLVENRIEQRIHEDRDLMKAKIQHIDISGGGEESKLKRLVEQTLNYKFDFEKELLFDVKIIRCEGERCFLLFTIHHAISDAVSMEILKKEINVLYHAYQHGGHNPLVPLKFQYKNYAHWVNQYLQSEEGKAAELFYRETIGRSLSIEYAGSDDPHAWREMISESYRQGLEAEIARAACQPGARVHPEAFGTIVNLYTPKGGYYKTFVPDSLLTDLRKFAVSCQSSLYMILISSFVLMLYSVQKNKVVRVYIPFSTRVREEFEGIVGWLTSEIIACIAVDASITVRKFIAKVSDIVLETSRHLFYPHEKIMNDLDIPLHILSPVLINLISHHDSVLYDFTPVHAQHGSGHFNLHCQILEFQNGLSLNVNYRSGVYDAGSIEYMMTMYTDLLEKIAGDSDITVSELLQPTPLVSVS